MAHSQATRGAAGSLVVRPAAALAGGDPLFQRDLRRWWGRLGFRHRTSSRDERLRNCIVGPAGRPGLPFFPTPTRPILGRCVGPPVGRTPARPRKGCRLATAPSPNDLTRQQLDELDALLQRMLSLPLDAPSAAGPAPPAAPLPDPAPP